MTADFGGLRMKHVYKIIALISALCLMLGMFSGCTGVEVEHKDYSEVVSDTTAELENLDNGVVAESEYFKMVWNKSSVGEDGTEYPRAMIEFVSKKDGSVWSTTPKEYYDTTDPGTLFGSSPINSSLIVTLRKGEQFFAYDAYEKCIMNNRFSSVMRKDGKGITVTYYFDEFGVIVSVDYYLEDDGFKIGVDPKNIHSYLVEDPDADKSLHNQSEGIFKVVGVTPAPFLCSSMNTPANSKDSYFVVPSGSGALMYIDQRTDSDSIAGRAFGDPDYLNPNDRSGWVYGEDYAVDKYNNPSNETPITMPFYGIKKGENALCAIIEQSAEACKLSAKVGDPSTGLDIFSEAPYGYSYLSATYSTIGYNQVYSSGSWRLHYDEDVNRNITPLVIGYYPLSGEDAGYVGMAKRYQKYLVEKENLKKSQDNSLLNVKFYGSYIQDELAVGIPYGKDVALTSYDEATEILSELKKISGGNLTAIMQGYGEGGIASNEIAGGFTLTDSVAGDEDDLKDFIEYTKSNGIKTFFNFDTINFFESGNGYSISSDSADSANGITAPVYNFLISTHDRYTKSKGGKVGALIARDQMDDVVNDVVALADKMGITGLAFDTLGNTCYSDYDTLEDDDTTFKYPLRNEMGNDVKAIAKDVKKKSKTVLMDGAFSYAAVGADIITNVPTSSTKSNAFDLEIPLYQLVFQGYRSNSVGAINTAGNKRTQFLKAIETGSGLSFELINNYDREVRKQLLPGLHAALYEDNVQLIKDCVNEAQGYLTKVAGAKISNHRYVAKNVTETVFDNGVTVLVNYNDTDYRIGNTVIKAQGFLVK